MGTYDEEEFISYKPNLGDVCPLCKIGKMIKSKKGKLYCSELCWLKQNKNKATRS